MTSIAKTTVKLMKVVGRDSRKAGFLMLLLMLTLMFFAGFADSASIGMRSAPSDSAPGPARWNNIDFTCRYDFQGNVFEDENLSAIARVSENLCLIGADEGGRLQIVELSKSERSLRVVTDMLLAGGDSEIDIEAIACDRSYAGQAGDNFCYVTGSHALSKKDGRLQQNRFKIFRFRINPVTALPQRGTRSGTGMADDLEVASLSGLLENDPVLGPYFRKPLQQKGINIEGLAVRAGKLYIGFRSPNLGGAAYVMEIAADELFADKDKKRYTLHRLLLGKGYGIREIVAAQSCFLIIAGNAGSEPSDKYPESEDYNKAMGYVMFGWDGKGSGVHKIGSLTNVPGKAEAMMILSESQRQIEVLILFDGPEKGGPTVYRIY